MQKVAQNGLEWLEFDLLADNPHLKHAVYLRHGGKSEGPYTTLNVSYDVGDRNDHVKANIDLIQSHLQQNIEQQIQIFLAKQCHGKHIAHINAQSPLEPPSCDALVTSTQGIALMINHADCQAAIFYDPIHRAIANVHAGWRGSVQNIYGETVEFMQKKFGSRPADLLVCISPSLGPDDAQFIHYKQELPEDFWHFQTRPSYFDFWAISEFQLQEAGVLPHHIEIARISNYSNTQDYFSYRKEKITGRHATCVVLV